MNAVALVPARAGSQRVPGKNVRPLAGHPLIAYTLAAALESELFDAVVVSTDSEEIAAVARDYGAETPVLRPSELATATSPDIEWIRHLLAHLEAEGRTYEIFSLLRPTSPFRQAATIRRAMDALLAHPEADSIRAVELCRQHPGKMWVLDGGYMKPLLESPAGEVPYHSRQYQSLPPVYAQNSSLEIARTRIVEENEIAGSLVLPFVCDGAEGFSIDYPSDWDAAERMAVSGEAPLPFVAHERLTPAPGGPR
jgi:CMP-N,N'-diacetyllegionaminic acid synthase